MRGDSPGDAARTAAKVENAHVTTQERGYDTAEAGFVCPVDAAGRIWNNETGPVTVQRPDETSVRRSAFHSAFGHCLNRLHQ
ncbi:MAG: hypothetical protein ACYC91_01050 [Solirubrobacteraceae bacterium]